MICLDATVLIEIIVGRKNAITCREYLINADEDLATTMLSVDLVMYYIERSRLNVVPSEQFLRQFIWLPLTDIDADWAFKHFNGKDFEDGLQIACAKREKCARFVTLDKSLSRKYVSEMSIDLLES